LQSVFYFPIISESISPVVVVQIFYSKTITKKETALHSLQKSFEFKSLLNLSNIMLLEGGWSKQAGSRDLPSVKCYKINPLGEATPYGVTLYGTICGRGMGIVLGSFTLLAYACLACW